MLYFLADVMHLRKSYLIKHLIRCVLVVYGRVIALHYIVVLILESI